MPEQIEEDKSNTSWASYQRLVLANQDRNQKDIEELRDRISKLETSNAVLKTKILGIGTLIGLLVSSVAEFVARYLFGHK